VKFHTYGAQRADLRPDGDAGYRKRVQLTLHRFEFDDIAAVIEAYSSVVGKSTLPPWFFGAWKSRDWRTENQETVLLDLHKQRELGIPCRSS